MKSNLITICLLIIICLMMASCGSLEQGNPSNSTALFTPKVTGLWIMDETGAPAGSWGRPKSELAPYPNPTYAQFHIPFEVKSDSTIVFIWAARALGPYEEDNNFSYGGGASVYAPSAANTLSIFNGLLTKGNYVFFYDPASLSSGFYTVYLQLEGRIELADILVAQKLEDVPLYLRDILGLP